MRVRLDGGSGDARFVIDEDVVHWTGDGVEPNGDAALTMTLLPALATGESELHIDAPVDGELLDRVPDLVRLMSDWFFGGRAPALQVTAPRSTPEPRAAESTPGVGFSGGADSFHTLLTRQPSPQRLVFVVGFDVDRPEQEALVVPRMREAAEALERPLHVLRTNLRHWAMPRCDFAAFHGAALITTGHVLREHVNEFVVASSSYLMDRPWGSHPDFDPLWSTSRVRVEHHGAATTRSEKLRQIAQDPVVQGHLRVCLSNRGGRFNCGRCEKCVRTMIALHIVGALEQVQTLPDRVRPQDVLRVPHLSGRRQAFAREILEELRAWGQDAALERALVHRMRRPTWKHRARLLQRRLSYLARTRAARS